MNRSVMAALLLCGSAVALAQTPATKPPVRKAPPKAAAKAPAKPAPKPSELVLPEPDTDQAAAATLVNYGDYACEFSQTVEVTPSQKHVGYVEVGFGKLRYIMKPVLSGTGALRLEDVRGQTMMLQIAFKSMLMDVQAGRRLVDECVHEKQLAARKAYEGSQGSATSGLLNGTPAGTVPQANAAAKPAAGVAAAPAAAPAAQAASAVAGSAAVAAPAAASAPAAQAPTAAGGGTAAGMASGAAAPAPSSSGGTL